MRTISSSADSVFSQFHTLILKLVLYTAGNGNDAVLYNTEWVADAHGNPDRVVMFTGADDQ